VTEVGAPRKPVGSKERMGPRARGARTKATNGGGEARSHPYQNPNRRGAGRSERGCCREEGSGSGLRLASCMFQEGRLEVWSCFCSKSSRFALCTIKGGGAERL
jgi:hypothetical protein